LTNGIEGIIAQLEKQHAAVSRALMALRELGEVAASAQVPPAPAATQEVSGRKGKKRTPAQRRRMAEAQRKRYADLRGASEPTVAPALEASKPKRKISPEGIERIIAATKKQWALKRASEKAAREQGDAKKAARKQAVKKSAGVKKAAAVKKSSH